MCTTAFRHIRMMIIWTYLTFSHGVQVMAFKVRRDCIFMHRQQPLRELIRFSADIYLGMSCFPKNLKMNSI